ncbi:MAG: M48 family metallopeptidase [Candidatus Pacebacteria bacterium]|nr:M48 family metallopeptidase [Candidatus Paceibacterota bacterium]
MLFGFSPLSFRVTRKKSARRKKTSGVSVQERELAREYVQSRIDHWNSFYNFSYNKVFIRNQRTRWGSCSSLGNLNFNSRIMRLSPELRDYIVVHELCHLQEFNHSPAFWDLVGETIPEYTMLRKNLKKYRV